MSIPQQPIVTADLYDEHHDRVQVCELQFRSFGQRLSFFGPCSTVSTFEDHTPVLKALEAPGRGRVLVVNAQGSLRIGVMGDRLAEIGTTSGWVGIVINGAIRDSVGIDKLDLGVKALGVTARRGWSPGPAAWDVPLQFGSVTIKPGDWIYADQDAVLVSEQSLALMGSPVQE
ncbi:MAG TPA: ribonuclease E activity regulator RraA [Arsenicitalea sp.]|jgi:regulator of ribonuclease activity A|nr:ribonuclease E activity regulator RraA [Arsenicitalea sp.]